jgi:CRP/FNR family transcriptional activator FtrB
MRDVVGKDHALMEATMRELALAYRDLVLALADMKLRQSAERLGNLLLQQAPSGCARQGAIGTEKRLLASLLGMTPENLSRAFAVLGQHGVGANGTTAIITDRVALSPFARPDLIEK